MSGSYGSLNAKYNTLYALYLQLQQSITGNTLGEVLDAGNVASKEIDMDNNSLLNVNQISDSNGNKGLVNQVLVSGGADAPFIWGSGGSGSIGTLDEVLNEGNVASKEIDMNNFDIINIKSLDISTAPVATPELTFTRTSIPIVVDGITYYIGLFNVPP